MNLKHTRFVVGFPAGREAFSRGLRPAYGRTEGDASMCEIIVLLREVGCFRWEWADHQTVGLV